MRPPLVGGLAWGLAWLGAVAACGPKPEPRASDDEAAQAERGAEQAPAPAVEQPAAEPEAEPAPEPEPEPEPELDERQLALANVGRAAFDALQAGAFADFIQLTPFQSGSLRELCPHMSLGNRRELEARFNHCHQTIDWQAVAEAQVFAGKPTGAPAGGCEASIEDYGRLQLFVHMNDATIWRVDFHGAVGKGGNAIGINGELSCQLVDKAPKLSP